MLFLLVVSYFLAFSDYQSLKQLNIHPFRLLTREGPHIKLDLVSYFTILGELDERLLASTSPD